MARFEFNDYGQASNAAFLGDFGNREHILPGGAKLDSSAAFSATGDVTVHNTAAASAGATSITVTALTAAIPSGTTLVFSDGTAVVTAANASVGATSITTEPLGEALADESDAVYDAEGADEEIVIAGTLVGRTTAERAAGDPFGPAADADDEIFIMVHDVDLTKTDDVDLVRHGTLIKQNFLPSYSAASATIKGKLATSYQLVLG